MTLKLLSLAVLLLLVKDITGDHPKRDKEKGYRHRYKSVPEELVNVSISFRGNFPRWLKGSLVRVAPALFEIGDNPKSYVTDPLDGLAKLAHWKFNGYDNTALFSTKFIRSTYYNESQASRKFTSNIFLSPPVPALTDSEIQRSQEVGIDNMDVSIVEFPEPGSDRGHVVATNDILSVYKISLDDLSTVLKATPVIPGTSGSSRSETPAFIKHLATSHPLPEPNKKGNLINVVIEAALPPEDVNLMKLVRIKSLDQAEVIASWRIPEVPFLHSFSLSETKAVIVMNPYILNVTCQVNIDGDCYKWKEGDEPVTVYVVDLRNGNMKELKIPKTFVLHHVNSYDESDDVLIADVTTYQDPVAHHKAPLSKKKDSAGRSLSETKALLQRIKVFLSNNTATLRAIPSSSEKSEIASTLDYPSINEANQSKPYCYVYGVVHNLRYPIPGSKGIAKKDVCHNDEKQSKDAIFQNRSWLPQEPIFVAAPDAKEEDDGVLLVPVTAPADERTHLLILDAKTLTYMALAEGPTLIPVGQHGKYFEE